jgi:hypothetical protein
MASHTPLHPSLDMTTAETRVREAATSIGWNDEDRLSQVLNCMKEEQVVFAWQLPALDSAQWKELGAPIGLAAAVKQLAVLKESTTTDELVVARAAFGSPARSSMGSPSSKSVDNYLLQVGFSSESDVFEDQEEEEEVPFDTGALRLFPVTLHHDKEKPNAGQSSSAPSTPARSSTPQSPTASDSSKPIHSSGSSAIRRRPGRTSSLPDMGSHHKRKGGLTPNVLAYTSNPGMLGRILLLNGISFHC